MKSQVQVVIFAVSFFGSALGALTFAGSALAEGPATSPKSPTVEETVPTEVSPRAGWSFKEAAQIPVQAGGRIKPLDSYAREVSLFVTGSRSFQGWDPVELLVSWMTFPKAWESREFIQVQREDVKRQLGLDEKRMRFTPAELFKDSYLVQYAEELFRKGEQPPVAGMKQEPREQELKNLLDRIGTFRRIVSGEAWLLIPTAPPAAWQNLATTDSSGNQIRAKFATMALAYRDGDLPHFETASTESREAIETSVTSLSKENANIKSSIWAEYVYNRTHPFLMAWILYLTSALLWLVAIAIKRDGLAKIAFGLNITALVCHVTGFLMRCYVAGRPPVTNMYESVIWVSFGVVVFALILYRMHKQPVLMIVASTLATLGLIAADSAPAVMDPGIHPLVPVLRSNYWLTIHVLTITLGYAAFALTTGLGNVTLFQFMKGGPGSSARINVLNQLTYRAMQFGVVLLAAGTILGGIWADYSWGRFWGWDPKEVWALIALLGYLAVIHARFTGWMTQFGFTVWTVISFTLVVMAWYGVNFVLGVGLHSYGFSTGGRGTVAACVLAQIVYIAIVAIAKFRRNSVEKTLRSTPAPA